MSKPYKQKKSKFWWVTIYDRGRRIRESTRMESYQDAVRYLKIREGEIAAGRAPRNPITINFNELFSDLVTDYQLNKRKTLRDLQHRLDTYLRPYFGKWRIPEVTGAEVKAFIQERLAQQGGNSAGEINRELSVLRRALNLGVSHGKVSPSPLKIEMLKEHNVRQGFFTDEEVSLLVSHLPLNIQPVIRFAYLTGWRIYSEVLPLRWKNVEMDCVRLDPGTTKNEDARIFPMTDALHQILVDSRDPRFPLCPWVFHRSGSRIKDFKSSWNKACRLSGLMGRIPHDLRRSAVRNMVRAGVHDIIAMKLTGHRTRSVFDRYSIVSPNDLKEAAEKLGSKRKEQRIGG